MSCTNCVLDVIKARQSIRKFERGFVIEHDLLEKIVAAGREGPSGRGFQPLRFHVIPTFEKVRDAAQPVQEQVLKMIPARDYDLTNSLFYDASAAIIITTREDVDTDKCMYAQYDAGFAAANIETAAQSAGLSSVTVGLAVLFQDHFAKVLDFKPGEKVVLAVGLGKKSPEFTLPKPERKTDVVWH